MVFLRLPEIETTEVSFIGIQQAVLQYKRRLTLAGNGPLNCPGWAFGIYQAENEIATVRHTSSDARPHLSPDNLRRKSSSTPTLHGFRFGFHRTMFPTVGEQLGPILRACS